MHTRSWIAPALATALIGLSAACGNPSDPADGTSPRLLLLVAPSVGDPTVLAGDSAVNTCAPQFCISFFPEPVEPLFGYAAVPRRPLIFLRTFPEGEVTVGTYPVTREPSDPFQMIGMELDGPDAYWLALSGSIRITRVDDDYVTGEVDVEAPPAEPSLASFPTLRIQGSFVAPRH